VATLPELEYPRRWPAGVHVTGPMFFDPPHERRPLPEGDEPLVLVAPSTVKDREGRLIAAALEGLAGEPLRVVVTTGGAPLKLRSGVPANATVADWVDYPAAMAAAALVVCHGNHGTVARALSEGVPVLVSPALPDDAEHGARVAWTGAGLMVPKRLLGARSLRVAARRLLGDASHAQRAREIAESARRRGAGAARGADLAENHARSAGR
jgi:UDP:flavonoid glycosyltransferase YjiC (YdhE family)